MVKYAVGGAVLLAGAGGTLFMHYRNDHLACITKPKGGSDNDIRETLLLLPRDIGDYVGVRSVIHKLVSSLQHELLL